MKLNSAKGEAPQGHLEVSGTQMSDLRVKSEIESLTEVVESLHVVKLFRTDFRFLYLSLRSETFASQISFLFLVKFSLMSAAAGASCLCPCMSEANTVKRGDWEEKQPVSRDSQQHRSVF